jgi:hypothetical protein
MLGLDKIQPLASVATNNQKHHGIKTTALAPALPALHTMPPMPPPSKAEALSLSSKLDDQFQLRFSFLCDVAQSRKYKLIRV